jgi:hypothetical protein
MIAPGVLITAAHLVHADGDSTRKVHTVFEVIGAVDIGQKMERATFVAEDVLRDTALLRLDNPRSISCVSLETTRVPTGTSCGSLWFRLARVVSSPSGPSLSLAERFQGASISAFHAQSDLDGRSLDYY